MIGGSGNGEQIAANKVVGVRAALVWSTSTALLAREHNDASVLAVGGSRPALESFVEFRGREPEPDALLRSYGLAA